jgi:hypothetical protein
MTKIILHRNKHSINGKLATKIWKIQNPTPLNTFFFFLHVHTRGGGEIRTSDLRFTAS